MAHNAGISDEDEEVRDGERISDERDGDLAMASVAEDDEDVGKEESEFYYARRIPKAENLVTK